MIPRLTLLLAIAAATFLPSFSLAQTNKTEKVFVGYVFRAPTKINYKLYTHLCHAFLTANKDGAIRTNANLPNPTTRKWDDETKTPWLIAPDASGVIGYDDAESLALKTDWAMKQNLRGVFFWEISADRLPDGANPLQQSSRQKFNLAEK